MYRTLRPLSDRLFKATELPNPEAAAGADAEIDPAVPAVRPAGGAKAERRAKASLRDRVQAGSAHFEFEALLHGASTHPDPLYGVNPRDGACVVWIPPGEFVMGSDVGEAREGPAHRVAISGFWIYKHPVTVEQYSKFYAAIGREMRARPAWDWRTDHPVVNVSWEYASAYAVWAGAVLPTEAEWEFCARGPEGRRYPWGDAWEPGRCCNAALTEQAAVTPVGQFPRGASPHGVLDLAGNVWEWTADWYDEAYYSVSPSADPGGPATGSHRALRGGSWGNDMPSDYLATTRAMCEPTARGSSIGFRCAIRSDRLPPPKSM